MYNVTFWSDNSQLHSFHRQVTLKVILCVSDCSMIKVSVTDLLFDMIVVMFSETCSSKNWVFIIFMISPIFKNMSWYITLQEKMVLWFLLQNTENSWTFDTFLKVTFFLTFEKLAIYDTKCIPNKEIYFRSFL